MQWTLNTALAALYVAQERYEAIGFYDDPECAEEVQEIDTAITAIKSVLSLEEETVTNVLREAIGALEENWTEYYRDQTPDEEHRKMLECLNTLSVQAGNADQIHVVFK